MTPDPNSAATILEVGKSLERKPAVIETPVGPFLATPGGFETESLEEYKPAPRFLTQAVLVDTPDSFVRYVSLFAGTDRRPVVFADLKQPETARLVAVLDYHGGPDQPSWNRHTVTMPFKFRRHFAEWLAKNKAPMNQTAFATFIEDHIGQIAAPAGGTLHELCLQFDAKKTVDFKSHQRLQDGSVQFTYNEDVQGTVRAGEMKMPTQMTLQMALFDGGQPQQLTARIRFRVEAAGKLVLWFELQEVEDLVEQELTTITATVATALKDQTRGMVFGRV